MKKLFCSILLSIVYSVNELSAQCAMCRATVENNFSNGDVGIGAGLNLGILYLFIMPYLAIGITGFLWYRRSKTNARKYRKITGDR